MTTPPTPDDPASSEPAASEATPPSEERDAIDWPDRSHWSEFDLAIEAGLAASDSLEADPNSEGATQPRS